MKWGVRRGVRIMSVHKVQLRLVFLTCFLAFFGVGLNSANAVIWYNFTYLPTSTIYVSFPNTKIGKQWEDQLNVYWTFTQRERTLRTKLEGAVFYTPLQFGPWTITTAGNDCASGGSSFYQCYFNVDFAPVTVGYFSWNVDVMSIVTKPLLGVKKNYPLYLNLAGYGISASSPPPPASIPLPASLAFFASGLIALGVFGWRRKRKMAALLAAA